MIQVEIYKEFETIQEISQERPKEKETEKFNIHQKQKEKQKSQKRRYSKKNNSYNPSKFKFNIAKALSYSSKKRLSEHFSYVFNHSNSRN